MSGSKVLVVNSGSSSLKFQLFNKAKGLSAVARGVIDQIGDASASTLRVTAGQDGLSLAGAQEQTTKEPVNDHKEALNLATDFLRQLKWAKDLQQDLVGCGHRVVHGRDFPRAALVDQAIRKLIQDGAAMAPLHNPANLLGIDAASKVYPGTPQVAVFDTAFHQTMTPGTFTYALPQDICREHGIRKYGAHGTSYRYLVQESSRLMGKPSDDLNLILCHIGAGASLCAVENGRSVDTTMGLTPLEGLVMASRCGDVDPAAVLYLLEHVTGGDIQKADKLLNKQSGLIGLTGHQDLKRVLDDAAAGDEQAVTAAEVYVGRIQKYVGAYMMKLRGKVDAIVVAGGAGEASSDLRQRLFSDMQRFGLELDEARNKAVRRGEAACISKEGSSMALWVIPTDEELSIARQTLEVIHEE